MKKLFSILLILSLFTVCIIGSAVAEEIQEVTIGEKQIKLGMTKEEVSQLTEAREVKNNSDWLLNIWTFFPDEDYDRNSFDLMPLPRNFLVRGGPFAGFDSVEFIYGFNESDILTSVVIINGHSYDKSNLISKESSHENYTKLNNALSTKYGDPISYDNRVVDYNINNYTALQAINERWFTDRQSTFTTYEEPNTTVLNVSQYLVKQENGYVDIILLEYNRKLTYVEHDFIKKTKEEITEGCGFILSYSLVPSEIIDSMILDIQEKEEALNSDI